MKHPQIFPERDRIEEIETKHQIILNWIDVTVVSIGGKHWFTNVDGSSFSQPQAVVTDGHSIDDLQPAAAGLDGFGCQSTAQNNPPNEIGEKKKTNVFP